MQCMMQVLNRSKVAAAVKPHEQKQVYTTPAQSLCGVRRNAQSDATQHTTTNMLTTDTNPQKTQQCLTQAVYDTGIKS